jgi:hypothetical protein
MAKGKLIKGQTVIYKTLHRKQKIEQHELYIYVHCQHEDVYSGFKRVNFVFMLFLLIYLYWCPTRFQYQMMFLLYYLYFFCL